MCTDKFPLVLTGAKRSVKHAQTQEYGPQRRPQINKSGTSYSQIVKYISITFQIYEGCMTKDEA